ncbi:MAG: 50S ribosomal protein L24 [Planctomycetaceae bacterium]|nr:MAG: 50S ribosomal protein L24 [Planctomycetaceae bacterium]
MKIKKGDQVVVVTGEDRGTTPRTVTQVLDGGRKLIVAGVNRVYKHVKRGHPKSPQGGRLSLEMPIDASNVKYYCPECRRGVRLGYRYTTDGRKERYCRKCHKSAGIISPPRPRYAQSAGQ